jgi:hypothetical protein
MEIPIMRKNAERFVGIKPWEIGRRVLRKIFERETIKYTLNRFICTHHDL